MKPWKNSEILQVSKISKNTAKIRLFAWSSGVICLVALLATNPYCKSHYVEALSRRVHENWCGQPEAAFCEMVTPMTRPILQTFLSPITQHQNFLLFTAFHTRVSCTKVIGIGIGGRYFIWQEPNEDTPICNPLSPNS